MWITSTTIPEDFSKEEFRHHVGDFFIEMQNIINEGVETDGHLLAPYDTNTIVIENLAAGDVIRRAWALESSARRIANFVNNLEPKQITVVVEEQDI